MESQKQEDNEYIFRSLYPSVPIPDKLTLVINIAKNSFSFPVSVYYNLG